MVLCLELIQRRFPQNIVHVMEKGKTSAPGFAPNNKRNLL